MTPDGPRRTPGRPDAERSACELNVEGCPGRARRAHRRWRRRRASAWFEANGDTSQAANAWSTVGQRLSDVERSVRAEDGSWRLVELARLVLTEPRRVSDLTA